MRPKGQEKKKRSCLKCNKEFDSTGPGNRICFKCNGQNESMRATAQASGGNGRVVRKSIEGGNQ